MDVQAVRSPGGIGAWLVEDYGDPMFAVGFAFLGASAQDPSGKQGLANFLTLLLGKDAGDLTAVEFAQRRAELAIAVTFRIAWDAVHGCIESLSETRQDAAELVNLALARPRFDREAVERVRRRLVSYHGGEIRRARFMAETEWNAMAFPDHPYALVIPGTEASVSEITAEDIKSYHRRMFAMDRLKVVAVGAITAEELGEFVDRLFHGLPAVGELAELPIPEPVRGGRLRVAEMELPYSAVTFGTASVPYDSPDFIPAHLLSYILGGDSLHSRLGLELRQKRGLSFTAVTWLDHRQHGAVLRGRLTTSNETVAEALEITREEMRKMADGQLSEAELEDAKRFLIGSHLLGFGSQAETAAQLLRFAMDGFGTDFVETRKALLAAVTLEDLKRVASHVLDPENLIVSIAGAPALQPARTR
jgi:zinc protease